MAEPVPTTRLYNPRELPTEPDADIEFLLNGDELSEENSPSDNELARWAPFGHFVQHALRSPGSPSAIAIPEHIGPFRVIRMLGRGGNGTVYLASDHALPRAVAVKVPHGDLLRVEGTRERFLQEAKLVAGLKHPHIVEIHQIGEANDFPFLVFEYCEGGSLAEWLGRRKEALGPRTCAEIVKMLAQAVQHAHAQGILHRDLNPRNILLVPDHKIGDTTANRPFPFVVKLSDFGLGTWLDATRDAVQTQTGTVVGTIPYMAPEQTSGTTRFLQPTVDVHALGVILFELLTQQRPYAGSTPVDTLRLIQESAPPFPRRIRQTIPRDLETICLKCLEKVPTQRYQAAQSLVDDLERFLNNRPILAHRTSVGMRAVHWLTRHPLVASLVSIICLLTGLIGIGTAWYSARLAMSIAMTGEFRTKSEENQEKVRSLEYASRIQRSQELLDGGYDHAAGQVLSKELPKFGEPDRRNFEWYHLQQSAGGELTPMVRPNVDNNSIYSVAPSRDGKSIYVGCNGFIEQWDIAARRLKASHKLPVELDIIVDLVNEKSGDLLFAVAGSSGIQRWSPSKNGLVAPACDPVPKYNFCNRLVMSPDDRSVVSFASRSRPFHPPVVLRLNDTETGKLLWTRKWELYGVDIAVDPAAKHIMALVSNAIFVLNFDGVMVQIIKLKVDSPELSIAISADGVWMAIALENGGIHAFKKGADGIWGFAGELPMNRRPHRNSDWERYPNPLVFGPGQATLYSVFESELHLWDVASLKELESVKKLPNPVKRLELLPDDRGVVWASSFDLETWKPAPPMPQVAGHPKETWAVTFSPDGRLLATGSDDETVKIWDVKTGKELQSLKGHIATVSCLAFSPDSRKLASGSLDKTLRVWELDQPGKFQELRGHKGTVRCVSWSSDGKRLISGDKCKGFNPGVIVWDAVAGKPLNIWREQRDLIQDVLFMKDGRRCVTASEDMSILIRDLDTGRIQKTLTETHFLHSAVLLNDERWLATGNSFGIVSLWDLESGLLLEELLGHAESVRSLAVSPDGKVLASGSQDSTVRLWDPVSRECLLVLRGHQAPINSIAFSPDGKILASGAHDGSVKLWHAPNMPSRAPQRLLSASK